MRSRITSRASCSRLVPMRIYIKLIILAAIQRNSSQSQKSLYGHIQILSCARTLHNCIALPIATTLYSYLCKCIKLPRIGNEPVDVNAALVSNKMDFVHSASSQLHESWFWFVKIHHARKQNQNNNTNENTAKHANMDASCLRSSLVFLVALIASNEPVYGDRSVMIGYSAELAKTMNSIMYWMSFLVNSFFNRRPTHTRQSRPNTSHQRIAKCSEEVEEHQF